ncbi:hypothetical protein QBC45DRAFT_302211, partial [Copromyces sp. CBS 386.78]
ASTCAMLVRSTEAKERRNNNNPHPCMPSRRNNPLNTINTGQCRHDARVSYHI